MGRKSKKERVFVYVQPIHFSVQWKITQHSKAITGQSKLIKRQIQALLIFPSVTDTALNRNMLTKASIADVQNINPLFTIDC